MWTCPFGGCWFIIVQPASRFVFFAGSSTKQFPPSLVAANDLSDPSDIPCDTNSMFSKFATDCRNQKTRTLEEISGDKDGRSTVSISYHILNLSSTYYTSYITYINHISCIIYHVSYIIHYISYVISWPTCYFSHIYSYIYTLSIDDTLFDTRYTMRYICWQLLKAPFCGLILFDEALGHAFHSGSPFWHIEVDGASVNKWQRRSKS